MVKKEPKPKTEPIITDQRIRQSTLLVELQKRPQTEAMKARIDRVKNQLIEMGKE
jgi:hypothetical protein